MNETLQEFVDSRGVAVRVDREKSVIRGVKILGLASQNGRVYLPDALVEAVGLYENTKVNVNHPKGSPSGPRDYQDRIGVMRNVVVRAADGLFGDLHFNPKHALAEQLAWDAEHTPENVGFSHNVLARTSRRGDRVVVEAITRVQSVDLVADPATTRGLFEATPEAAESTEGPDEASATVAWAELSVEALRATRPDLVESLVSEERGEVARLEAEIDQLQAAAVVQQKQETIRRLLSEHQLPDPDSAGGWAKSVVSDRFIESLLAAGDEDAMRRLVEDRSRLARAGAIHRRPQSREPGPIDGTAPENAETFVQSIT